MPAAATAGQAARAFFFGPQGSSNGAVSDAREIGLGSSDLRYSDALLKAHACVTRIMPAHGRALRPRGSSVEVAPSNGLQCSPPSATGSTRSHGQCQGPGQVTGAGTASCTLAGHVGQARSACQCPSESAARRRAASANGSIRAPRILLGHGSLGQARDTQDQQTALAC